MRSALLWLLILASPALGQSCPPGSTNCPNPQAARAIPPRPPYLFRHASGMPEPWSTAVRITATEPGSKLSQVGSGTVIDGSPARALVMTCAHVLRGRRPSLTVEIFGPNIDHFGKGSVGSPIARFVGFEVDRIEALDVGLVTFSPGRPLEASLLAEPGGVPSPEAPLCSLGCSNGDNPTALSERYTRTVRHDSIYLGFETDRSPKHGRSGGGLFNEDGRLIGVCDFGETSAQVGLYAATSSLREILRRNGLVELSEGRKAVPPQIPPPTPIQVIPPVIAEAGRDAVSLLGPMILGGSLGGVGLLAGLASLLRRPRPTTPTTPTATALSPPVTLEDLARLLVAGLKERDERAASQKSDAELLDKIKSLVGEPKPASPPN